MKNMYLILSIAICGNILNINSMNSKFKPEDVQQYDSLKQDLLAKRDIIVAVNFDGEHPYMTEYAVKDLLKGEELLCWSRQEVAVVRLNHRIVTGEIAAIAYDMRNNESRRG